MNFPMLAPCVETPVDSEFEAHSVEKSSTERKGHVPRNHLK